jgi:hypothetical protein
MSTEAGVCIIVVCLHVTSVLEVEIQTVTYKNII